jgi:hypothetical protein
MRASSRGRKERRQEQKRTLKVAVRLLQGSVLEYSQNESLICHLVPVAQAVGIGLLGLILAYMLSLRQHPKSLTT